ncbi:MAG TPA: DUF1501 domain-containing protein [Verrucomicrobiales bacterium]|nr:DUF1501 domain-containing protein [Verrucomicrobiales bacterium]|tara:strand:- start:238 stop:1650 length:1413 start_codon:yes stop_codon:yes gene_type:complete
MLSFRGGPAKNCDGLSRRSFLRAGSLGIGGLSLPDLIRAESVSGQGSSSKSIIHIHLDGGPPQMDMIDPKPDSPVEYRGDIKSIPSEIPGIHLSELMPNLAKNAKKFAFLRSLVGADGQHNAYQCQSGYKASEKGPAGGWPAMGCVINKLLGSPSAPAPTFVDLMQGRGQVRNSVRPGFLGPSANPFRPDISSMFKRELEDAMKTELAKLRKGHSVDLNLNEDLNVGRLDDRLGLLQGLDRTRREIDAIGSMEALDTFTQQAYGILTSGKIAEAMDLSKEDPKVISRYVPVMKEKELAFFTSEGPQAAKKLLLARRLIEAGVRVVNVSISDFDTHSKNFVRMKQLVPIVDHAISTLIEDLDERGMLDDVTVLAWGEFGRTPKVNANAGRDHWPKVAMGILAGGGMNVGQVIGATDRYAAEAVQRPVHYKDVIATLYHNLGIDPQQTTVEDSSGRPHYLLKDCRPIKELIA